MFTAKGLPPPPASHPSFSLRSQICAFFLITDPDADKDPVLDPWFDDQKFSKKKFTNSFGLLDPDLDTHFICYIKSNSFFYFDIDKRPYRHEEG